MLAAFILVLAGGNFTHLEMVPHQHETTDYAHSSGDTHRHADQSPHDQANGAQALHCGANILLLTGSMYLIDGCEAETFRPATAAIFSEFTHPFDPPPPRKYS